MVIAAATLLLVGCIPPFIWPHVETQRSDVGYILPVSGAEPWLHLDNGLDFYAWQDCYGYVSHRDPCEGPSLTAVPAGTAPDWMHLLRWYSPTTAASDSRVEIVRPLSAYAGTTDRLLGLFRRYEGSPAKDDDIRLVRPASEDRYDQRALGAAPFTERSINIWHDMSASGAEVGEIQLVVYDDQHVWIFASSVDKQGATDLYVPEKLFHFKGDIRALMSQPMLLYYDDDVSQGNARRVVANEMDASRGHRIPFKQMPLPNEFFEVDPVAFRRPVRRDQLPTVLCHYSESEFHASMLDDYQRRAPELKSCKPFSEDALHDIERHRKT